jgi:hypothetical protein
MASKYTKISFATEPRYLPNPVMLILVQSQLTCMDISESKDLRGANLIGLAFKELILNRLTFGELTF